MTRAKSCSTHQGRVNMSSFELFPCPGRRLADTDRALATSLNEMLEKEVRSKRLELKEDYEGLLRPALERVLVDVGLQKVFWDESLGGEGHNGPEAAFTVARWFFECETL